MLPEVPDEVLVVELRTVISAGWRLLERPAWAGRIRHLLQAVPSRPYDLFRTRAEALMRMLGEAFERNVDESLSSNHEPILTWDKMKGLRILFGIDSHYHWTKLAIRRTDGAALILGTTKGISAYNVWDKYEEGFAQLALTCLRASLSLPDQASKPYTFTVIRRTSASVVGPNRLVTRVEISSVSRANYDGLDQIYLWVHAGSVDAILHIAEVSGGVGMPTIEQWKQGKYHLAFPITHSLQMGEDLAWSFVREWEYPVDLAPPAEDHMSVSTVDDGYTVALNVRFDCSYPHVVWRFGLPRFRRPGKPEPATLLHPDDDRSVYFPETHETVSSHAYGIAWRWHEGNQQLYDH
jgi:hypothetical protein